MVYDYEKRVVKKLIGKTLLIEESCYWGCSTDNCRPFEKDKIFTFKSWDDVYELTYKEAIKKVIIHCISVRFLILRVGLGVYCT